MTRPAPIIAGTLAALLLLFGAYMGSYYAMVQRINQVSFNGWKSVGFVYRIDGLLVYRFYGPAHRLDRLIRPGHWGDK